MQKIKPEWIIMGASIFYAVFLFLFSFDSFGSGSIWLDLAQFFVHNIFVGVILLCTYAAWKNLFLAGLLFFGLGVIATTFFETYTSLWLFILVSLPLFLFSAGYFLMYSSNLKKNP